MSRVLGFMMIFAGTALLCFCLLNLLVGCETWSDPACVTPGQFIRMWWRF